MVALDAEADLTLARVQHDVARQFGDRGDDHRQFDQREAELRGERAALLPRLDDVGIAADVDGDLAGHGSEPPPSLRWLRWRYASPSSRSSAVTTPSSVEPSCTIENATSGWIPTTTVSAPRSAIISAMSRSVRQAKESMTSTAVTSTMTPRER